MTATAAPDAAPLTRDDASRWIARLHDDVVELFESLDHGGKFREDRWDREGGGGGTARVLIEGETFEKAGINRSEVFGELPPAAAKRLGGQGAAQGDTRFYATGMSLVVHPRSPMIPTVHLNVRYFELSDGDGNPTDAWFGGGTDLTPTYPFEEDAVLFHRALRDLCDRHHHAFYPRFKAWCDEYFRNTHREGEARGIGGIFFDHLRPGAADGGLNAAAMHAFVDDVGRALRTAYAPIVDRRRDTPYGDEERGFQLERRGRYVEFNLLHDRGTTFGLQTNARVESVLMSLPPLAAWNYAPSYAAGSFQARLIGMLQPRDWCDRA
jgi:coproporphyrinogen III oxidase